MEEIIRERQRCRNLLTLRTRFSLLLLSFSFFLSMDEIYGMGCACAWYVAKFGGHKWSVIIKVISHCDSCESLIITYTEGRREWWWAKSFWAVLRFQKESTFFVWASVVAFVAVRVWRNQSKGMQIGFEPHFENNCCRFS